MRKLILAGLLLAACTLGISPADAQGVRDKILVIANAELKEGDAAKGIVPSGNVLTVEKVSGDWYWVHYTAGRLRGWIHRSKVLSLPAAMDRFTNQLQTRPTAEIYAYRALIWIERGELDLALRDLDDAIRLDSRDEQAYHTRAHVYAEKKQWARAIPDLNKALSLTTSSNSRWAIFHNRGHMWLKLQNYDSAISDFSECIRVIPTHADSFAHRGEARSAKGELRIAKGDLDHALPDLTEAIRLDPKYAYAFGIRGIALEKKGDIAKAESDFDEHVRLSENRAKIPALLARADFLSRHELVAKARLDVDETLRIYSDRQVDSLQVIAWFLATSPRKELRDGAKAVELARKGCEFTNQADPAMLDVLAAALAETSNFDEAVQVSRKAIATSRSAKDKTLFQQRLDLYLQRKPFHLDTNVKTRF